MDMSQLRAFVAITQQGSFVRAAETLGIAQATISARMQQLEKAVGGPLFTRGRKVRLTQKGEAFLPYARRALEVLDEGAEVVQSPETYRLTLAATESLGGRFLAEVVATYLGAHPSAHVFAQSSTCTQVMRLLQDQIMQFGLLPWPYAGAPADLKVLDQYQEDVVAVTSPRHPLLRKESVTSADLHRDGPWLFTWLDEPADAQLQPQGLGHRSNLNLPAHTAKHLLLEGHGVALMTRTVVRDELARGELCELRGLTGLPKARGLALVHTGRELISSEARQALRQAVRASAIKLGFSEGTLETEVA